MMRRNFTLIEVLVAIALTSVLFAAVVGVFHRSFRFRDRQDERAAENRRRRVAITRISLDLNGVVVPTGTIAGPFVGTEAEEQGVRRDTLMLVTSGKPTNAEIFGGDLERITYELFEPDNEKAEEVGYELVRLREENLLAVETEDPVGTVVLTGVKSLEFSYYDGADWQESWDSTTQDNALPMLVKMRLEFMPESEELQSPPIELTIPVIVEAPPKKESAQGGGIL